MAGDNSYEAADNSFEVDKIEGGVRAACIFLLWFEGATACSPENVQIRCDPTKYIHVELFPRHNNFKGHI